MTINRSNPNARLRASPRVEHVLQAVADQVEAEHGDRDRETREGVHPPVALEEVLEAELDHRAPLSSGSLDAESDKGEAGGLEDRPTELKRRHNEDRRDAVRHKVAKDDDAMVGPDGT